MKKSDTRSSIKRETRYLSEHVQTETEKEKEATQIRNKKD